MVDVTKFIQSDYLDISDVTDPTKKWQIENQGDFRTNKRGYERFDLLLVQEGSGKQKKFSMNADEVKKISAVLGTDSDKWPGNFLRLVVIKAPTREGKFYDKIVISDVLQRSEVVD